MMRLVDGQPLKQKARDIAASLRRGERIALDFDAAMAPDRVVAAVVHELGNEAVVASVPAAIEQVSRTILELSSVLDPKDVGQVDEALREQKPGATQAALNRLTQALEGRIVVVLNVENLALPESNEIAGALREQRQACYGWISQRANLATAPRWLSSWAAHRQTIAAPDAPPVELQNGGPRPPTFVWDNHRHLQTFELALTLEALGMSPYAEEVAGVIGSLTPESMRARVWEALPDGTLALMKVLAVHNRPMAHDVLERLPEYCNEDYQQGKELALWRERAGWVAVDAAWSDWCERTLPQAERQEAHRVLAETFAREVSPGDPSSCLAGLSMLEAQRHLLCVGDVDRALEYSRFGAELFVDAARRLSRERRFEESAALYGRLLSIQGLLSSRLWAYAKHYYHYNRSHARPELEPVRATAIGYEASSRDWGDNAIFWSRAVRAWYLAAEPSKAQQCLSQAMQKVPEHPDKKARLIARTARRLAEMGRVVDAIEVWGTYKPDTPRARDDAARLTACLSDGWEAERLEVSGLRPLVLLRPERFKIVQQQDGWRLVADRLGRSERSSTPLESVRDFVQRVALEVKGLVGKLDRELDDDERERKQALLSTVDVIASGLDAHAAPTTWVYGRLERDEQGALWLASTGNQAARYQVPEALAEREKVVVGDHAWLAEVVAGPSGVPKGPVQKLERLSRQDPETILRRWRERLEP
jgi:tetratricopeptide (TPR) repeat protein